MSKRKIKGRTKPGSNDQAKEYERHGIWQGITVKEWEEARGWPKYTLYPEAINADHISMVGYFMYREPTPEEEVWMRTQELKRAANARRNAKAKAMRLEEKKNSSPKGYPKRKFRPNYLMPHTGMEENR